MQNKMDSNEIFRTIRDATLVKNKRNELHSLCKENILQILQGIPIRILNNDGVEVLKALLYGFSDNSTSSCKIRVQIVDIVLKTMRKKSAPLSHCGNLICWLCLEFPRLPVNDLVKWTNESIQSIVQDTDVNMIWQNILPEALNAIELSRTTVKYGDVNMSSEDYKEQCINSLCQHQWKEKQIVTLVSMFKDIRLNLNQHKQIVNKACSYIVQTTPDTLPPLVYQLLKLCKSYNLEIVLAHLSYYFSIRLYSKLEPPPPDSQSTMDVEDFVEYSAAEISNSLSTCLYHISKGPVDPDTIRKHIKAWPKTQLLRNPFILDVALALSDKGSDFRAVCLDTIKSAIEQRILDELRSKESAWLRSVLPPDVDVVCLLKVLSTESGNHRQLTSMGLINLAFNLLLVKNTRPTAPLCWCHGNLILVRLCSSQAYTASHILSVLGDRLAGTSIQIQFADCLHVLCKTTPVSVERCTQLKNILENCQPSPTDYKAAATVLDAVRPLLNYSTRTRDALFMACRKWLYSGLSVNRCLGLSGYLTVLRNIKISSGVASSTSSQSLASEESSYSYLTQLTVDCYAISQTNELRSRFRNEAVCSEVVLIIRRCLAQDAAVKQLLYTKLYDCTKEKTTLHERILEMLYNHLRNYVSGSNNRTSILFDKCIKQTDTGAILIEPISNLIYAIAKFLHEDDDNDLEDILTSQTRDTACVALKNTLGSMLNSLCMNEELALVNLNDPGINDVTPESKAEYLKVQQIIQCHEALIAYKIMQWNKNAEGFADSVYNMYTRCNNVMEQTKTPAKAKKGNKSSLNSQTSQKSQKNKSKTTNSAKDKAGPFKALPCLWDMKLCLRVLQLLYSEGVSWSMQNECYALRGRSNFHHFALKCILSALATDLEKSVIGNYVTAIATVVYRTCLCRFQFVCTFDDVTAVHCILIFKACLSLLFSPKYSMKMDVFLPKIVNAVNSKASACLSKILDSVYNALAQINDEVAQKDAVSVKMAASLSELAGMLLMIPVPSCKKMFDTIRKYEDYLRTSNTACLSLISPVLAASCREQQEAPFLDNLLTKLITTLGVIFEEEDSSYEPSSDFPTIDTTTGQTALVQVCVHLNARLEIVEHLLNRAKDLALAESLAIKEHQHRIAKEHKEVYQSIVLQLCQFCTWTSLYAKMQCRLGAPSDKVLSTCVTFYRMMARLAKQIDVPTAQLVRFERLVKLGGKKLSSVMDNLISYVETIQETGSSKEVLRRTKLIPTLVFESEQFNSQVAIMSNKAKLNWQQYLSLGTARDFKIDVQILRKALNNEEQAGEQNADDPESAINASSDSENEESETE